MGTCGICLELPAPKDALLLECGHTYCRDCLTAQLQQKSSKADRISFGASSCAHCRAEIQTSDPRVTRLLAPLLALKSTVQSMAIAKLKALGRLPPCLCALESAKKTGRGAEESAPSASSAAGSRKRNRIAAPPAHKKEFPDVCPKAALGTCRPLSSAAAADYAMSLLSFFVCGKCHKVFWGGLRDCELETSAASGPSASSTASGDSDCVMCPGCVALPAGFDVCKEHGRDGIEWKCLWCCSPATHVCRAGTNYYCDSCHDIADKNARTTGAPMNWAPLLARDRHRQCRGDGRCALGVAHPPHGTRFPLRCSLCQLKAVEADAAAVPSAAAVPVGRPLPAPSPIALSCSESSDDDDDDDGGILDIIAPSARPKAVRLKETTVRRRTGSVAKPPLRQPARTPAYESSDNEDFHVAAVVSAQERNVSTSRPPRPQTGSSTSHGQVVELLDDSQAMVAAEGGPDNAIELLDDSEVMFVPSDDSPVAARPVAALKRVRADFEILDDSQGGAVGWDDSFEEITGSRAQAHGAGAITYGSLAFETNAWRVAASACSSRGSAHVSVVDHESVLFEGHAMPIVLDASSGGGSGSQRCTGYCTRLHLTVAGFACDVSFLHIPVSTFDSAALPRCEVLSVTPAADIASISNMHYISSPHEVATAKLATLFARIACLPRDHLRRAELSKRIARGGAKTEQDRMFRATAQVSISDDEGADAAAVLAALQQHGSFRASAADVRSSAAGASRMSAAAAAARMNVISAIAYTAENVRRHCFVCSCLLAAPGIVPRTCGSDACVAAELHCLAYMDLPTELAAKGEPVTALLLQSALGASQDAHLRDSLLDEAPVLYRRDKKGAAAAAPVPAGPPGYARAAAATAVALPPQHYAVDWTLLAADLGGLAASLHIGKLLSLPNIRAVREHIAQLQQAAGASSHSAAAHARRALRSSDPLAEGEGAWRLGGGGGAGGVEDLSAPLPLCRLPPAIPVHHWPLAPMAAAGSTTSPAHAAADPDRWFRLLWWLLRTVRCDFVPVTAWARLPGIVQSDPSLRALAAQRGHPAAPGGGPMPPHLGSAFAASLGLGPLHAGIMSGLHHAASGMMGALPPHLQHAAAAAASSAPVLGLKVHVFALHQHCAPAAAAAGGGGSGGGRGAPPPAPAPPPPPPVVRGSKRGRHRSGRAAAPAPPPAVAAHPGSHGTLTAAGGPPVLVFHGSKQSRWHSILRGGLRPLSGTAYMAVGAAYGPGVYLGKSFGVASPYSLLQPAGPGAPQQYAAVALVRATPGPALREIPYPGGAYACTAAAAMELELLILVTQ